MIERKRIAQLALIMETELNMAQLDLANLRRREEELRDALNALSASLRDRAQLSNENADAARIAGADISWQTWVEQRRRLINQELAHCLVMQDKSKDVVLRAFGREKAVIDLQKRNLRKLQKLQTRKSSYV